MSFNLIIVAQYMLDFDHLTITTQCIIDTAWYPAKYIHGMLYSFESNLPRGKV